MSRSLYNTSPLTNKGLDRLLADLASLDEMPATMPVAEQPSCRTLPDLDDLDARILANDALTVEQPRSPSPISASNPLQRPATGWDDEEWAGYLDWTAETATKEAIRVGWDEDGSYSDTLLRLLESLVAPRHERMSDSTHTAMAKDLLSRIRPQG